METTPCPSRTGHDRWKGFVWKARLQKKSTVVACGITNKTPDLATAEPILKDNRQHWSIENSCHYIIDWNYDLDRNKISKRYGPEDMPSSKRSAVGLTQRIFRFQNGLSSLTIFLDYIFKATPFTFENYIDSRYSP